MNKSVIDHCPCHVMMRFLMSAHKFLQQVMRRSVAVQESGNFGNPESKSCVLDSKCCGKEPKKWNQQNQLTNCTCYHIDDTVSQAGSEVSAENRD